MFDILDDDQDELEYTTEELDAYFDMTHLYCTASDDEEEIIYDDDDDDDDEGDGDDVDVEEGEQVLSQKLSQLSTHDDDDEESCLTSKKIKRTDAMQQAKVPAYLSSRDNGSFHRAMKLVVERNRSINVDELRDMAILKHHIAALGVRKEISMVYLQSGTGTLTEPELEMVAVDRRVWPSQVTSALATPGDDCEKLVHQRLREMDEQIRSFERQLGEMKKRHSDDAIVQVMERSVHDFVEQYGMVPLRMKRDLKIKLLEHGYNAEILERKFRQENPNAYQVSDLRLIFSSSSSSSSSSRMFRWTWHNGCMLPSMTWNKLAMN
jgi:hypothetical protein